MKRAQLNVSELPPAEATNLEFVFCGLCIVFDPLGGSIQKESALRALVLAAMIAAGIGG